MLLGAHESTAGGLHEAFARALADGAEAVQIFTKSSRMWRAKEITAADVAQFRAAATLPVSVHSSYLVNLGADAGDLREKSIAAFVDELQRCDLLGIPHLVVHPGANADKPRGLANVAGALDRVFEAHRGPCRVLLETAAGQGSALGSRFEELRAVRDRCKSPDRVAICLDTCHVFAAGAPLDEEGGATATVDRLVEIAGPGRLRLIHANDSMDVRGAFRDRHENIGAGHIGEGAFRELFAHPATDGVPFILETRGSRDVGNADLATLRRLRAEAGAAR
jgi:deoxyribonuclease-4